MYSESQVHQCPVCNGLGTWPPDSNPGPHKECHGCEGKGWVVVWQHYEVRNEPKSTQTEVIYKDKTS